MASQAYTNRFLYQFGIYFTPKDFHFIFNGVPFYSEQLRILMPTHVQIIFNCRSKIPISLNVVSINVNIARQENYNDKHGLMYDKMHYLSHLAQDFNCAFVPR